MTSKTNKYLEIDRSEFLSIFEEISKIGWSEIYGMNRLALDENDIKARHMLIKRLKEINSLIRIDDAGNIMGVLEGDTKEIIATGSHLDAVPGGGRFDGTVGVVGALYALRYIVKNKIKTRHSIMAIDFTNEEGSRFQPSKMGSGLTTGVYDKEYIYSRKDAKGITFGEALKLSGFMGDQNNRLMYSPIKSYVELHIEQGPILEAEGYEIGIPHGIVGMVYLEVNFIGEQAHAGTTPIRYRSDALVPAGILIKEIRDYIKSLDDSLRITVGKIDIWPNIHNVIPGIAKLIIDIRSFYNKILSDAIKYIIDISNLIAKKEGNIEVEVKKLWESPRVVFDKKLRDLIINTCQELRLKCKEDIYSWAGHDAQNMSRITKTAMIFIPSHKGKSHTKEEYTSEKDLINRMKLLLNTMLVLDLS